jgi:hypothetical protein
MLDKIISIFKIGPYTYGATRTDRNIGSNNEAFGRPYLPIESGLYGPRYNVKRDFAPMGGGSIISAQALPKVDIRGNGIYFAGDFSLTALSGDATGNI